MDSHNSSKISDMILKRVETDCSKIMNLCRLCMMAGNNMKLIFGTGSRNIADKILYCTGVQVSKVDGLPSQVCPKCLRYLAVAYRFKVTCIYVQDALHKHIDVKTKMTKVEDIKMETHNLDDQYEDNFVDEDWDDKKGIKTEHKKTLLSNDYEIDEKVNNENKITFELELKPLSNSNIVHKKLSVKKLPNKKSLGKQLRRVPCRVCNIMFPNKVIRNKHYAEKHRDPDGAMCEVCGKSFRHKSTMYAHMSSHRLPRYMCDHCGYKTCRKTDLIKHLRIHSDKKLYKCASCPASFHNTSNMRRHMRVAHAAAGGKRLSCHLCQRMFHERGELNRHVRRHNNQIMRPECNVCHNTFSCRKHYKRHMLRQHNISLPPERPGRKKSLIVIET